MKRSTKAGYGSAELGLSAVELMLQVYLLELYIVAGLDPFWAGLALAIAVFWDAVSDPLMGVISDRTRSKTQAGKRLPYYIIGSLLLGIATVYLFRPGATFGQQGLFAHLLIWYLVVNTAMTLIAVPHLAMANDLGKSQGERTELFGWRLGFSGLGLLVGLVIPVLLAGGEGRAALMQTRSDSGLWVGLLATSICFVSLAFVWKPLKARPSVEMKSRVEASIWHSLKVGLTSYQMKAILIAFVFISIGRAFNSSLALVFYKGTLAFTEKQVGQVLIVLALSIIVAAPIWVRLTRRFSKLDLSIGALVALSVMTAVSYPFFPKTLIWPVLIVAIMGGALVASIALLEALFSDSVEAVEIERQEVVAGASYGIWRMATKIARALGLLCSGWFLSLVGYREGLSQQSEFVERSVAWAFGPGVALFFGAGGWMLWRLKRRANA